MASFFRLVQVHKHTKISMNVPKCKKKEAARILALSATTIHCSYSILKLMQQDNNNIGTDEQY
jgi:hypothetical protein